MKEWNWKDFKDKDRDYVTTDFNKRQETSFVTLGDVYTRAYQFKHFHVGNWNQNTLFLPVFVRKVLARVHKLYLYSVITSLTPWRLKWTIRIQFVAQTEHYVSMEKKPKDECCTEK